MQLVDITTHIQRLNGSCKFKDRKGLVIENWVPVTRQQGSKSSDIIYKCGYFVGFAYSVKKSDVSMELEIPFK